MRSYFVEADLEAADGTAVQATRLDNESRARAETR
jgi:hypothetical protein